MDYCFGVKESDAVGLVCFAANFGLFEYCELAEHFLLSFV